MFENSLAQLAIVATFVQRFIALIKPLYKETTYQKWFDLGLSVIVSAFLCVSWSVDVFSVAEIVFFLPWVGSALTGVIAALGANVLNDVLVLLETWKNQKKVELAYATVQTVEAVEEQEGI